MFFYCCTFQGFEVMDLYLIASIGTGYAPADLIAKLMMFLPCRSIAVLTHPCKPCMGTMLGGLVFIGGLHEACKHYRQHVAGCVLLCTFINTSD